MRFSDISGQRAAKQDLLNIASGDRLPHAIMLVGPEGSAKLAFALAFVQYILCQNPDENDACGTCSACTRHQKLAHPDVHFSYPTIGSKAVSSHFLDTWRKSLIENPYLSTNTWLEALGAENKQGNITKDECVEIIKKLSLKSYSNGYKFMLIWMPEYLGKEGNRLLKIIEEPPEKTIFILIAENTELILNTLLSRCQLIKINAFADEEISQMLIDSGKSPSTAQEIAVLVDGNFNEALALALQSDSNNAALFLDWLRKCYLGKAPDIVAWTEDFAKLGRESQKQFFKYGLFFLREFLILLHTGSTHLRLRDKELAVAQNLSKVLAFEEVAFLTQLLNDCYYYIERNANPKILLTDASIQAHKSIRRKAKILAH